MTTDLKVMTGRSHDLFESGEPGSNYNSQGELNICSGVSILTQ